MSIWTYSDTLADLEVVEQAVSRKDCPFCRTALETLKASKSELEPARGVALDLKIAVRACPICGWWVSSREEFTRLPEEAGFRRPGFTRYFSTSPHELRVFGAAACLKQLDVTDISVPVQEIRDFLAAKYDARFRVNPRIFEEVVASVFRDLGYRARVTAYSGDDGIDVILDGDDDKAVGVQVKRYKNRIEVDQIRSPGPGCQTRIRPWRSA